MRKILILLISCITVNFVHAQSHIRDSLNKLLQQHPADTTRVLILGDLCLEYLESKPDSTLILAVEALALSHKLGYVKGEAVSLNRISNAYDAFGNYPKSMEYLLQALKINEKIHNEDGLQRNSNNIGIIYFQQGDYRQALEYYFRAKALAEKLNNKRSLSIIVGNIGDAYYHMKVYDSARLYSQQGHDIASAINYPRMIGACLYFLGNIHLATGQHRLAMEYYRMSVPNLVKAENFGRLSTAYSGMAKVFEKNNQLDSTYYYSRQALAIAHDRKFTKEVMEASSYLATFFKNRRNADSAFYYLEVARAANDSLFNQQRVKQLQSLSFDEKLRQQELEEARLLAREERKHNLQYAAIAIGLITFVILFVVLSRTIIVRQKFIEFFGILGLLSVFEFINLFIHPYLADMTDHSPLLMLAILIGIGALLVPIHRRLEIWVTKIMVEKNKKIRLLAAHNTITRLESV